MTHENTHARTRIDKKQQWGTTIFIVNFQTIAISKYFSSNNNVKKKFVVYYNIGDIAQIIHIYTHK